MYFRDYDFTQFKYGGYPRKSSEESERQIQSIPAQKKWIREEIDRDKLNLVYLCSESKSAFNEGRAEFNKLVRLTKRGEINAWLSWDPTRLSRNAFDSGVIIRLMDKGFLHHIRVKYRIYFNTARDKRDLSQAFVDAKYASDDKSELVKRGLKQRYEAKRIPTGKAPIGFINDKSKEKGDRGWLIDKERLKKKRKLLRRFLSGQDSVRSLTEYNANEVFLTAYPTKRQGGNILHHSQIHRMLKDPINAGLFYTTGKDGSKLLHKLDPRLPRLLTQDEHYKILDLLGARSVSKGSKRESIYTGFIKGKDGGFIGPDFTFQVICDCKKKFAYMNKTRCPNCGIRISAMRRPKYLSYVYHYNVRRKKYKQPYKSIEEKKISKFFLNYIRENITLSRSLCDWAIAHLQEYQDAELAENQEIIQNRIEFNNRIHREKKRLRKLLRTGDITKAEYQEDLADLNVQIKEVSLQEEVVNWMAEARNIFDLCDSLEAILSSKNSTKKEKKDLLQRLGSNLVWDEEKLNVINTKPILALVSGMDTIKTEFPEFEPRNYVVEKGQSCNSSSLRLSLLRVLDDVRTQLKNVKSNKI